MPYSGRDGKTSEGYEGVTIAKWYNAKDTNERRSITQSFGTRAFNALDCALANIVNQKNSFVKKHGLTGEEEIDPNNYLNDKWFNESSGAYDLTTLCLDEAQCSDVVYRLENDYVLYFDENPWLKMSGRIIMPNTRRIRDHMIIQKEQDFNFGAGRSSNNNSAKTFQFAIPLKLLEPLYVAIRIITM